MWHFPETSVSNYHSTLRKIPKDLRSHLHRGGSLELRKSREPSKWDMERAFPLSLMYTLCANLYIFLNAMCSESSGCDWLLSTKLHGVTSYEDMLSWELAFLDETNRFFVIWWSIRKTVPSTWDMTQCWKNLSYNVIQVRFYWQLRVSSECKSVCSCCPPFWHMAEFIPASWLTGNILKY
jgi:hypothetical protein